MKICKDCKKKKEDFDFYGIQGECKECTKKRIGKNYLKNKEYYQSYEKIRNRRPARKKQKLKYQNKLRKNHKGKYKARGKVNNSLRDGKITKLPCAVCGNAKSEAHHIDYRKKLEITWLCKKHHIEIHKKVY